MKAIVYTKYGSPDGLQISNRYAEKGHAKGKVVITSNELREGEEQ